MGSQLQASDDQVNIPSSWGGGSNRIAAIEEEGNTPPPITANNAHDDKELFDHDHDDPNHQVFFIYTCMILHDISIHPSVFSSP